MIQQIATTTASSPRIIGAAWGPPTSEKTYRGVPKRLFTELASIASVAGMLDLKQLRASDVLRGVVGLPRSIRERRPRVNPIWRYLPENIDRLSGRYECLSQFLPEHDVVLQFGVAGIASKRRPVVAHVEMSIATAVADALYAPAHGFSDPSSRMIDAAIEGERQFLRQCTLVWTNTVWTAKGLIKQGMSPDRIRVCAPACGVPDPGPVTREWRQPHILFVGEDWQRKGGPILVEAFRILKERVPEARLTIIGSSPESSFPGMRVLGRLDKNRPEHFSLLCDAYRKATVFCMPTLFDTTGIVFFEAAIYGLPLVMLKGQGREDVFPRTIAEHLDVPDPEELAAVLVDLASDPARMAEMGRRARDFVLESHTWPVTVRRIRDYLVEAIESHAVSRKPSDPSIRPTAVFSHA